MSCGLENMGNTCYMNSVLQLFMKCEKVVQFLLILSEKSSQDSTIFKNLYYFLQRYQKGDDFGPQEIREIMMEKKLFMRPQQYDAHEFLIQFLDILDEEAKRLKTESISSKFFSHKYYTIFNNLEREETKKIVATDTILTLPFSPSLIESLKNFHKKESLEEWESESFPKQRFKAEKNNEIFEWPDYLFIVINRYDVNFNKINADMDIPLQIGEYNFLGSVTHFGHFQFGHYVSMVSSSTSLKKEEQEDPLPCPEKEFTLCDDQLCKKIPIHEAERLIKKAYLLLYQKNP